MCHRCVAVKSMRFHHTLPWVGEDNAGKLVRERQTQKQEGKDYRGKDYKRGGEKRRKKEEGRSKFLALDELPITEGLKKGGNVTVVQILSDLSDPPLAGSGTFSFSRAFPASRFCGKRLHCLLDIQ